MSSVGDTYVIVTAVIGTENLLEEKALRPQVPSYSDSTVSPNRDKEGREEGAQEKKDSFSILLFPSSLPRMRARRGPAAAPASENERKKDRQASREEQAAPSLPSRGRGSDQREAAREARLAMHQSDNEGGERWAGRAVLASAPALLLLPLPPRTIQ